MPETCPTTKVKAANEEGFMVINASDFDEKIHTLFEAVKPTSDEQIAVEHKKRGRPAKE